MAHFAELNENNEVLRVVVINDENCLDDNGIESEKVGIAFCKNLFGGTWLQTSFNKQFRINFADNTMVYYPEVDAFMLPRPHPWYFINEDGQWTRPPHINDLTGKPFTHDELVYISYYCRHTKNYRLNPAIPKNGQTDFNILSCLTDDFTYTSFYELETGKDIMIETTKGSPNGVPVIEDGKIVFPYTFVFSKELQLAPIGLITHVKFDYLDIEKSNWNFNSHPQTVGKTIHELFRLIIEWAYAHTHLNNTELVSKVCHDILRELQMPIKVRNELLTEVEPQAVERYIRGLFPFKATSFDVIEDPECPPLFAKWYELISQKYRPIDSSKAIMVDMSKIPDTYPI